MDLQQHFMTGTLLGEQSITLITSRKSESSSESSSSPVASGHTLEPSRMFSSRMLSSFTSLSTDIDSMLLDDFSLAVSAVRSCSWNLLMRISCGS